MFERAPDPVRAGGGRGIGTCALACRDPTCPPKMRRSRKPDRPPLRASPIARQLRARAQSPVARQLRVQAVQRARRARWETLILLPLLVGVVYAYDHRRQL